MLIHVQIMKTGIQTDTCNISIIHISQKVEAIQMSINKWINKMCVYNGILFSCKKEWNSHVCNNRDELWKHYAGLADTWGREESDALRGHGSFIPFPHTSSDVPVLSGCSWVISFPNKPDLEDITRKTVCSLDETSSGPTTLAPWSQTCSPQNWQFS